jgi:CBS-domain-containing membrane protein
VAQDLLIEIPVLHPLDDLNRAIEAFGRFPGNRVPVLDEAGRIVGCVHKYDLMVAFARGPGSQDSRAEPDAPPAVG